MSFILSLKLLILWYSISSVTYAVFLVYSSIWINQQKQNGKSQLHKNTIIKSVTVIRTQSQVWRHKNRITRVTVIRTHSQVWQSLEYKHKCDSHSWATFADLNQSRIFLQVHLALVCQILITFTHFSFFSSFVSFIFES